MSAPDEPSGTAPLPTPDPSPAAGAEQTPHTPDEKSPHAPDAPDPPPTEPEEQLDWKEVIELQTFRFPPCFAVSGTRLRIHLQFLEQMPPIEVFVGMEAIRASAEEVPGLPTRQELQQWLVEHDAIEKETEIFDSGELQTIKKFTKAATQRNLSPADTDLIELTLTTIYELDKLLHLLRDRSENLELLGIRLSWEEFRTAAWIDRRTIIADLKTFLDTRARWTPAVYDEVHEEVPPPSSSVSKRRASLASLASAASDTLLASPGFSRSARFKLAEILSRDAAQFSARVTSLRHSKISAAGKKLDKLIDTSRKAVPEDLLDEQDRLEERGISELEHVGKFVMNAVMQWRKYCQLTEIYVESMKDQIEAAKFQHPTARQKALIKRLVLRGDPASPSSTFPQPTHVLFPEHKEVNDSVVSTALELARKVEAVAKEYRLNYEAVHRVETLVETASALSTTFTTVIERLEKGVSSTDGDGTPPNLMSEACLEPTRHGAFLALLPSILKEQETATDTAAQVLRNSRGALLGLDRPGIDPAFKTKAAAEFQRLSKLRGQAQWTREDVTTRVGRLREARKIWKLMDANLSELEDIRRDIGEAMEKHRWQQELNTNGAPPTPDSFSAPLPAESPRTESVKRLDDLSAKLTQEIDLPLSSLSRTLEAPLNERLSRSSAGLKHLLEQVRKMAGLLQAVKSQATVMSTIRDEFHDLQTRIDDLKMRVEKRIEQILAEKLVDSELSNFDSTLKNDINGVHSLHQRVPFVSRGPGPSPTATTFLSSFDEHQSSLDDAVRTDSNSYAMKLEQRATHFELAQIAKEVDASLSPVQLATFKSTFTTIVGRTAISQPLADSHAPGSHDPAVHESLYLARVRAVDDAELRFKAWTDDVDSLTKRVAEAQRAEAQRLEAERIAEEQRLQAERERLAAEEAERARLERERLEEQERLRLEEERLAEERRVQAEKERVAAEEAAQALIAKQQAEAKERERLELARVEEERRLQAEKERVAAEEAERARLERERLEMEAKLRLAEEQLAEERRLQAERVRIAAEQAERERAEKERLEQVERERVEEERRLQAEKERIAAEEAEVVRLAAEKAELERLRLERAERERAEEEQRLQAERARIAAQEAEQTRLAADKAEQERLENERLAMETKLRMVEEQLAEERRLASEKAEQERLEKEQERLAAQEAEKSRLREAEEAAQEAERKRKEKPASPDHDVFGIRGAPSDGAALQTAEMYELQTHIFALRKRLRALSIEGLAGSSFVSATYLPPADELDQVIRDFFLLCEEVATLPGSVEDPSVDVELNSLRTEVTRTSHLVEHLENLAKFTEGLHTCDAALSDLLEHIDTYPSVPLTLTSSFRAPTDLPAEEQLASRLSFTNSAIERLATLFALVKDDQRAIAERDRIQQTWSELEEMAKDRIVGRRSRPVSVASSGRGSGRSSSASVRSSNASVRSASIRKSPSKAPTYSGLSASATATGPSQQRARSRLVPPQPQSASRRSTYGTERSRPASQLSNISTNRSTSGPVIHGSTFASRQRTSSLTPSISGPRRSSGLHLPSHRTASPSVSDASSYSRSVMTPSRSSSNSTTRTPRYSLPPVPKSVTPKKKAPPPRKKYVANPKSKLDVAVGDVINKLPVGISIEGVSDSWKDQSGKYWIGDQDPRLCFCRILRSQTVMVRVGGGWTELSKFIKDHFADSFRLFEDSPPRPGAGEAKWISSATLLEAAEPDTPPRSPRTPEPRGSTMPSFSLLTPTGKSPQSLKSSPSNKGSPLSQGLTPLQFMRRAEPDAVPLQASPSKSTTLNHQRTRTTSSIHNTNTPARNSIWRP
ncbi:hypothetical protein DFH06DRAFT_1183443 [Mycena polygramma]|nr:hypothetical protein DFH06DRAFT_1183443 [Mycena polygramma]